MKRTPYVSKLRNEPRITESPPPLCDENYDREKHLAKNADPRAGRLTYRRQGPGFIKTYDESKAHNRLLIKSKYPGDCARIDSVLELEYRISTRYFGVIDAIVYAQASPVNDLLQRTFAANLVAIKAAFELTLDGVYASAMPLLRQAYEGLMLSKLCSLDPTSDVYDRWLDGQQIFFTQDVLSRITSPSTAEFKRLWQCLSRSTHASSICGQPDLANEPAVESAPLNFIFALMLLEANHHLLCSHFVTTSMRYYQRAWFPDGTLSEDRRLLRGLFMQRKASGMASGARTFIKDFRAKWTLR